ncbi:nucleoside-diphosphate-sugar epimerase [Terrimicrobium sacchariphilum]|uniref:Nucleoside-diphosphate-sugar epimerase n=1 Tax=Terrimicrobium sacchariphilum TaxID=690879 RepID=A0A146GCK1_TERSA|nr:NAD-dependent epimerase/dehydratase family protein [Terrimicrobium sacchariphilum]GAT34278.1 nucleoside-diphosphate-sugar epimerase [Terrimicrobium sacchariphilum]
MFRKNVRVLVAGAGGFIGGHLVCNLLKAGFQVRAVDRKPQWQWYQRYGEAENLTLNLEEKEACIQAANGCDEIYNLAADMGGMGFIELNKGKCMLSVLINTHLLQAAQICGVPRFFYASSACVYAGYKQTETSNPGLKETDAYPADPEDGYGWEKLFSERMCRHFMEDFGIETRVARYHNVYGPNGTYDGGREKAPAAICRKVITALRSGKLEIDIWGDGLQTRSFQYIDDCIFGTRAIMDSQIRQPLNLGSAEMVSINQLVAIVEDIAGVKLKHNYQLDKPKGVRGRSSDNTLIKELLDWEPSISLREGMEKTYAWIYDQIASEKSDSSIVNRF